MAKLDIQIQTRKMLKPSTPTPKHLKSLKLSLFDQGAPRMYVPILFHYLPSSEGIIERCDKLQKSLAETLTKFYPLAGRFSEDEFSIHCNDEGVEYVETKVKADLAEFLQQGPKCIGKNANYKGPEERANSPVKCHSMHSRNRRPPSFLQPLKYKVFILFLTFTLSCLTRGDSPPGDSSSKLFQGPGYITSYVLLSLVLLIITCYFIILVTFDPLVLDLAYKFNYTDFPCKQDIAAGIGRASIDDITSLSVTRGREVVKNLGRKDVDNYPSTSWCRFPWYEADFGWGKPSWVSSVSKYYEGKYYERISLIDTKSGDGIEAWIALKENDMVEFVQLKKKKKTWLNSREILTFCPSLLKTKISWLY
ncbi:acetyl-CoA-benzylalcohol acetyltransferase-like [Lycium barbarum]|uniref:acetyl-CoA-benzylalcohol acetyltransferase-like n=1 Tax=Lycium barbarum TaxID=112863 RepID=UPI00293EB7E4|nr:acetyl-CoA-benzylalcohol acetyltransferase-like [Lycium barbarum]